MVRFSADPLAVAFLLPSSARRKHPWVESHVLAFGRGIGDCRTGGRAFD